MTENIDDAAFMAALAELRAKDDPIVIQLPPIQAFILLGQLQLALHHPANTGPTAELSRRLARELERHVASEGVLKAVAEAGWEGVKDG